MLVTLARPQAPSYAEEAAPPAVPPPTPSPAQRGSVEAEVVWADAHEQLPLDLSEDDCSMVEAEADEEKDDLAEFDVATPRGPRLGAMRFPLRLQVHPPTKH